jgi:hypothetical protein
MTYVGYGASNPMCANCATIPVIPEFPYFCDIIMDICQGVDLKICSMCPYTLRCKACLYASPRQTVTAIFNAQDKDKTKVDDIKEEKVKKDDPLDYSCIYYTLKDDTLKSKAKIKEKLGQPVDDTIEPTKTPKDPDNISAEKSK